MTMKVLDVLEVLGLELRVGRGRIVGDPGAASSR